MCPPHEWCGSSQCSDAIFMFFYYFFEVFVARDTPGAIVSCTMKEPRVEIIKHLETHDILGLLPLRFTVEIFLSGKTPELSELWLAFLLASPFFVLKTWKNCSIYGWFLFMVVNILCFEKNRNFRFSITFCSLCNFFEEEYGGNFLSENTRNSSLVPPPPAPMAIPTAGSLFIWQHSPNFFHLKNPKNFRFTNIIANWKALFGGAAGGACVPCCCSPTCPPGDRNSPRSGSPPQWCSLPPAGGASWWRTGASAAGPLRGHRIRNRVECGPGLDGHQIGHKQNWGTPQNRHHQIWCHIPEAKNPTIFGHQQLRIAGVRKVKLKLKSSFVTRKAKLKLKSSFVT